MKLKLKLKSDLTSLSYLISLSHFFPLSLLSLLSPSLLSTGKLNFFLPPEFQNLFSNFLFCFCFLLLPFLFYCRKSWKKEEGPDRKQTINLSPSLKTEITSSNFLAIGKSLQRVNTVLIENDIFWDISTYKKHRINVRF